MCKIFKPFVFILLLQGFISQVHAAEITVTVTGIDEAVGNIQLTLFDDPEAFPDNKQVSVQHLVLAAKEEMVITQLAEVPPGTYALAVFHDANGNGILDRNFVGVPLEEYGFSNNVRPPLGVPSFAEAAFTVETQGVQPMIELQ